MSFSIGFDLGTHQTKICIQNSANPAEKVYEFLEFKKPDGTTTVLFPSIVQINLDNTVSYGFVDEDRCKLVDKPSVEKPVLELLDMPEKPEIPKMEKAKYPPKPLSDPWMDNLKKLKGENTSIEVWKEKCEAIDSKIIRAWNEKCLELKIKYEEQCRAVNIENRKRKELYDALFQKWEKSQIKEKLRFRYFKLNAIVGSNVWSSKTISSEEVTVWYIAYILILLREKLGNDYPVQFGVPVSGCISKRDKKLINITFSLFIAADKLANQYNSLSDYLKADYRTLTKKKDIVSVRQEEIDLNRFDDIPEAFSGLVSISQQKRLGMGFHLLVDIGGGTTDTAMFFVENSTNLPDVISIKSFPKGLNYIFENSSNKLTMEQKQQLFMAGHKEMFNEAVNIYKKELCNSCRELLYDLHKSFTDSKDYHGRRAYELSIVLENQPILYCGGGSVYSHLHSKVEQFNNIMKVNKDLLSIDHLLNKNIPNNLYPILAISYGLASFEKPYDGVFNNTDVKEVFRKKLPRKEVKERKEEHTMLDD